MNKKKGTFLIDSDFSEKCSFSFIFVGKRLLRVGFNDAGGRWGRDGVLAEAVQDRVKPTEATGGAEEAHRRWPGGCSEQGREQGKG